MRENFKKFKKNWTETRNWEPTIIKIFPILVVCISFRFICFWNVFLTCTNFLSLTNYVSVLEKKIITITKLTKGEQESHHSWPYQILNCLLNLFHVYPSREIKILVEKVTMPILFSSPCPCPYRPRSKACTSLISNTIQCIKHRLVSWKSFFCDHISNQHNKIVIRKFLWSFPQLLDLLIESFRLRLRQKILWLPTFLNRL